MGRGSSIRASQDHSMMGSMDDLLTVRPSIAEMKRIETTLRSRFHMTDLEPCSYYLGMTIQRE